MKWVKVKVKVSAGYVLSGSYKGKYFFYSFPASRGCLPTLAPGLLSSFKVNSGSHYITLALNLPH